MPNLTDVVLTEYAFQYKNDITITGSTCFISLLTHRYWGSSTLLS